MKPDTPESEARWHVPPPKNPRQLCGRPYIDDDPDNPEGWCGLPATHAGPHMMILWWTDALNDWPERP